MSSSVPQTDRVLRRRKVLGESNSENFDTYKIEVKSVEEKDNEKQEVVGIKKQKSSNMVVLVSGEPSHKTSISSIKTHVLEPVFVPANVDEIKIKRNIHTQIHLSYLKSFYRNDKQKTISKWNVGLKRRIMYRCKVNPGRYMVESYANNPQNDSKIFDALFNLYNNVTQEIFDTVSVVNMYSSNNILNEIIRIKSSLRNVETVVTNEDGNMSIETKNKEGCFIKIKKDKIKKREGFIVDLKPDLEVAQVTDNIFLGSQDVAMSETLLRENTITHIINVSIDVPNYFPDKFVYLSLKMYDRPDTNLNDYIPVINNFINDTIANFQNPKIFIHCNAGISRSVSVTMAYLILFCGLSYSEAYEKIKKVRKNAKPNDGFLNQLKNLKKQKKENVLCTD